jgi:hypothetical protein
MRIFMSCEASEGSVVLRSGVVLRGVVAKQYFRGKKSYLSPRPLDMISILLNATNRLKKMESRVSKWDGNRERGQSG